ncbi:hypothetical protein [Paenibacillus sp. USHLN196]|uniref:hypothetical protein n=1 Tax=Paenibacillus sp. USHLN196 TaxID=3081291 RepID=UPI0030166C4F
MKSVITQEHVDEFSKILELEGSIIRLYRNGDNVVDIVLSDSQYIKNFIVNPTKDFYKKLENFFAHKKIYELSYNNTGNCFWTFE